jgi:hypothetical protein
MTDARDLVCRTALTLLPSCLDDDLPKTQTIRIEQHLLVCPGCMTVWEQVRLGMRAVAALRPERARDAPWERVVTAVRAGGAGRFGAAPEPAPRALAYKFLRADRQSPLVGARWPEPGRGWMSGTSASSERDDRGWGVYAFHQADLAYWMGETLWIVQLDGKIERVETAVCAERASLVREVPGWPDAAAALAWDCLRRLERIAEDANASGSRSGHELGEYVDEVRDTVAGLQHDGGSATGVAADVAYTLAHVVGIVGWTDDSRTAAKAMNVDDPFEFERIRQSRWLAGRLGLVDLELQVRLNGGADPGQSHQR